LERIIRGMTKNEYQRWYRAQNKNACTTKYEKSKSGFLMRLYRNMQSRITGVQSKKAHLYEGKSLLTREEFYKWAASPTFDIMFATWENSGYDQKLTPTVDRERSTDGYEIGNMRWLTHSENSRLGSLSRHQKESSHEAA
jgi:hypothetical protein